MYGREAPNATARHTQKSPTDGGIYEESLGLARSLERYITTETFPPSCPIPTLVKAMARLEIIHPPPKLLGLHPTSHAKMCLYPCHCHRPTTGAWCFISNVYIKQSRSANDKPPTRLVSSPISGHGWSGYRFIWLLLLQGLGLIYSAIGGKVYLPCFPR